MPTLLTHGVIGVTGAVVTRSKTKKAIFFMMSIFATVLPDFDILSFKFGVKYSDFIGHRGFSHSIFLAVITAFILALISNKVFNDKSIKYYLIYFFILIISHSILDALTDGGLGVAFFSPFNNTRYFFPVTPIKVAPLSVSQLFTLNGLQVLKSEFLWVWLPSIGIITILSFKKKRT